MFWSPAFVVQLREGVIILRCVCWGGLEGCLRIGGCEGFWAWALPCPSPKGVITTAGIAGGNGGQGTPVLPQPGIFHLVTGGPVGHVRTGLSLHGFHGGMQHRRV
uniref:Uncharacterized protein n=1 Tax=Eutreptiella gymnastica TaxID=73025 RepID=A0A7S4LBH6_9EUGL